MHLRQKVVILLILLFPMTTHAQISFYKLPMEENELGIGLISAEELKVIHGTLGFATGNYSKVTVGAGLGFFEGSYLANNIFFDDSYDSYLSRHINIPPSPTIAISALSTKPLRQSGLEMFGTAGFGASHVRITEAATDKTLTTGQGFSVSVGGGILKRLEIESGLEIKPYFATSFNYSWNNEGTEKQDYLGSFGVDIDISPETSVSVAWNFSFQNSNTSIGIQLSFH